MLGFLKSSQEELCRDWKEILQWKSIPELPTSDSVSEQALAPIVSPGSLCLLVDTPLIFWIPMDFNSLGSWVFVSHTGNWLLLRFVLIPWVTELLSFSGVGDTGYCTKPGSSSSHNFFGDQFYWGKHLLQRWLSRDCCCSGKVPDPGKACAELGRDTHLDWVMQERQH